jgi:predicted negative regulator of RcsB-dependent stress response
MSAQSMANRSSRARHADPDDAMLARALEFADWARGNVKAVVIGVVLLVVLIGGGLYYRYYTTHRKLEAATELMKLQRTVNADNPQLAARDLEQFVHRYDGTTAAAEAQVALAQMYLQQNDAKKAVATLQGAGSRIGKSEVGPQAALLLAAAQSAAGDTKGAVTTYLAVADQAPHDYQKSEALEDAAVLRTESGDYKGAAELYQRLVDGAEKGSPQRQLYEMRLAEVQARAEFK